jgi:CheY-like chemotaxis protein
LRCVPTGLAARTDPVLFQRIVGNFIDNALRYSRRGGVVVGCRRRQGKTYIEVWDSGIGIPVDKIKEIFEEFRQLGDEARNSGSGLGLAIAAKTAALLGLDIQVRSWPGKGSVFAVEIPAGQARTLDASRPPSAVYRAKRIALVEDNNLVREALLTAMREAGHEVVAAASRDAILGALGTLAPDVLVTDYRLPQGITGFDVISALKDKFGEALPAIVISGDTDPALLRQMNQRGIIVLHKPIDLEELQSYLEDLTHSATADRLAPSARSSGPDAGGSGERLSDAEPATAPTRRDAPGPA